MKAVELARLGVGVLLMTGTLLVRVRSVVQPHSQSREMVGSLAVLLRHLRLVVWILPGLQVARSLE